MASLVTGLSLWIVAAMMVISTSGLELPEELTGDRPCTHEYAINLPTSNKCLVPVSTAYDWTVAQTKCEQVKGKLYTLPSGNLGYRPRLLRCLESMDEDIFSDMWINGASLWQPQFKWINGSVLNRVQYCPTRQPPVPVREEIVSSLSLDYCVARCQKKGFPYTILRSTTDNMKCYCINTLTFQDQQPCVSKRLNFENTTKYFIAPTQGGTLVDIANSVTFSTTDILCGLIDNNTAFDQHLKSDSCFTLRPFICALDKTDACKNPVCNSQQCNFMQGNRCLARVHFPNSWYSAKDYCRLQGGDLWTYNQAGDVQTLSQLLDSSTTKFWIGATNYQWEFDANSAKLYSLHGDFRTARCAHIYRSRAPSGVLTRTMQWSDTPCDQKKSFLCEFDQDEFKESEFGHEVTCPWAIPDRPGPVTGPGPVVVVDDDGDPFPWAAVISGIVAGLMLLSCLGLLCRLCGRKRWRRSKERVAFVPYFAGDTSHVEFETMSNADHHMRNNMRSASEHGSQTGLVKGGYHNASSYGMSNSNAEFSSKSLDRRHLEAMERKFSESQQYLANNSMEERAFSSSYQTMPAKGKDYMTLQANMRIQDDTELEAMRRSLRGKPEVTLVTDNMDMNFTVNHAHGNSRNGSDLERSMDEHHMHSSASGYEHRNRSFADIALHDL